MDSKKKKERNKFFILGVDDILEDGLKKSSEEKIVVRFFTTNEVYGPFPCECGDCGNRTFTVRLSKEENESLPEPRGHRAIRFIFEEKIGLAVCKKHMFHPPIPKKNLVYRKFGIGVRREREPLSEETKASLKLQRLNDKAWLDRCDAYKKYSQQRFGRW